MQECGVTSVTAEQMALSSVLNTEVQRPQIVWETTPISQMLFSLHEYS